MTHQKKVYFNIPVEQMLFTTYLLQAALIAFEADEVKALKLTGCHVSSLAELAVNRQSQVSYSLAKGNGT